MKSKTLSSNLTLFKKDITRFSPIWLLWSVMFLIVGYVYYVNGFDYSVEVQALPMNFMIPTMIYGLVCAVTLFGYLFDPKECITTHSLPIRRENMFFIHLLSGLVMYLVPTGIFCVSMAPMINGNPFVTLGLMALQFVFYFGLGIFCVMLTGRKFATLVLFALINFAAPLILLVVNILYIPMLPGVVLRTDPFMQFCPPAAMIYQSFNQMQSWTFTADLAPYVQTLGIFAVVGVVLMGVSVFLYRIRKLECAESFMAFSGLNLLFVVACTIFGSCFTISLTSMFGFGIEQHFWVMLLLGLVIGYFASLMLLKRTHRVFNAKSILALAVAAVLMSASVFVTKLDPMGLVSRIPNIDQVAQAEVFQYEDTYSPECYFTGDPEQIEKVQQLHQDLIDQDPVVLDEHNPDDYYSHTLHVELVYHLKNGTTIKREYRAADPARQQVIWYFSQPEYQLGVSTLEELLEQSREVYVNVVYPGQYLGENPEVELKKADYEELLKVVFDDCKAGKMFETYDEPYTTTTETTGTSEIDEPSAAQYTLGLYTQKHGEPTSTYHQISVPQTATNTNAWLNQYFKTHPLPTTD